MIFRVFLFARARDLAGADMVEVDLPEGATAGRLCGEYWPRRIRTWRAWCSGSALAVNDEFAKETEILPADAELALLPPVSGGC